MRILDVGCGGNKVFHRSVPYNRTDIRSVKPEVGLDIRPLLPEYAGFFRRFVLGDVRDMSVFDDGEFDIVVASHVLEHLSSLEDVRKAIREMRRVGRIIHIFLPSLPQFGIAELDHKLMWLHGFRKPPRLLRLLIGILWLPIESRYIRYPFNKMYEYRGYPGEKHFVVRGALGGSSNDAQQAST